MPGASGYIRALTVLPLSQTVSRLDNLQLISTLNFKVLGGFKMTEHDSERGRALGAVPSGDAT